MSPTTTLREVASPRVLLVSPRCQEAAVWRGGQIECEDVVRDVDDVDLITPCSRPPSSGFVMRKAQRAAQKLLHLEFAFTPPLAPVKLRRDYDVMFVYAQNINDFRALDAVQDWRKHCAKAVCIIEELWVENLRRYGDHGLERLADFDMVGVGFRDSASALHSMTGLPCVWIPGGVDTLRFYPGATPPPRTIDVFSMGRRSPESHQTLLSCSQERGWTYLFDTIHVGGVLDGNHQQHRTQLAALVNRSRYFIANKSRVGASDTGGQEDLGFRSYEGAAGGAVLIGDAPKSRSAQLLFDWPDAHIDVPFGSPDLIDAIDQLDADPERVARIRHANVTNCLRRHDWAYRWESMLQAIGLAPRDKLAKRVRKLNALADSFEGESYEPAFSHLGARSRSRNS